MQSDPRFHWDSFFFGTCVAVFLQVAFGDYMPIILPTPMVEDSGTKLIMGLAGLGFSVLYLLHMLHQPKVIPAGCPDCQNCQVHCNTHCKVCQQGD